MATFDDVKDSLFTAGKEITQKAKDVSEIARLRIDIRTKEDFIDNQFKELGKAYYEARKDAEDVDPEEGNQFIGIEEALAEIARMKDEIQNLKGSIVCPKCGSKMAEGAVFCSKCGAKLDDMFEE